MTEQTKELPGVDAAEEYGSEEEIEEEEQEESDDSSKEQRIAKLATPSNRIFCATYEAFQDVLSDDKAARIKRRVDYINKKPLE